MSLKSRPGLRTKGRKIKGGDRAGLQLPQPARGAPLWKSYYYRCLVRLAWETTGFIRELSKTMSSQWPLLPQGGTTEQPMSLAPAPPITPAFALRRPRHDHHEPT